MGGWKAELLWVLLMVGWDWGHHTRYKKLEARSPSSPDVSFEFILFLSSAQVSKAPSTPVPPSPAPTPGLTKRVKKSKQPLQVTKDLGRWKPADDLLLINAVLQVQPQVAHPPARSPRSPAPKVAQQPPGGSERRVLPSSKAGANPSRALQTNDLTSVHLGVKFSCRFTLREVQERWYALLYDPVISK